MFELMLNCENPELVEKYMKIYPVDGVTCNPKMVARLKNPNFFEVIRTLRKVVGDKKLFVQVTSPVYEEMLEEAEIIRKVAGEDTIVKFPITETGLSALKEASRRGYKTCATIVYNAGQGIMALQAGADYIAPFYRYIENAGLNAEEEIKKIAAYKKMSGCKGIILGASAKSFEQITEAIAAGCDGMTVDPGDLSKAMDVKETAEVLSDFMACWEETYGVGAKIIDMKDEVQ